jgi:hypothetical protein
MGTDVSKLNVIKEFEKQKKLNKLDPSICKRAFAVSKSKIYPQIPSELKTEAMWIYGWKKNLCSTFEIPFKIRSHYFCLKCVELEISLDNLVKCIDMIPGDIMSNVLINNLLLIIDSEYVKYPCTCIFPNMLFLTNNVLIIQVG